MYSQSKAEYKLANRNFVEIRLYGRRNSIYYGFTLGRQFLALQEAYTSTGKKSWAPNKKYFSKRVGSPISRDLKEPRVV